MLQIFKNVDLKKYSSMQVAGVTASFLVEVENLNDLEEFINKIDSGFFGSSPEIFVIGDGTNTIFVRNNKNRVLLKLNIKNIERLSSPFPEGGVNVGAGVNWDTFVQEYIQLGGVGMEALSAIPGTVGASLVQNIGAYGQEVSNFVISASVFDVKDRITKTILSADLQFAYRSSIFKTEKFNNNSRYIILSIIFKMKKEEAKVPEYKDIQYALFNKNKIKEASDFWNLALPANLEDFKKQKYSVNDIRSAVLFVRKLKLPDPKIIPNCGSFFKNPIISKKELEFVQERFPEIPVFKILDSSSQFKIPIAYIIEQIGLKGVSVGSFGIYKDHALVVTSNGSGDNDEFVGFVQYIKQKVFDASGINIQEEVNLV